jgi:hypothetical protein
MEIYQCWDKRYYGGLRLEETGHFNVSSLKIFTKKGGAMNDGAFRNGECALNQVLYMALELGEGKWKLGFTTGLDHRLKLPRNGATLMYDGVRTPFRAEKTCYNASSCEATAAKSYIPGRSWITRVSGYCGLWNAHFQSDWIYIP